VRHEALEVELTDAFALEQIHGVALLLVEHLDEDGIAADHLLVGGDDVDRRALEDAPHTERLLDLDVDVLRELFDAVVEELV